jgi:hypothetical protein
MADVTVKTPMQYLDKATGALRDMGLMPAKVEPAPINALLEKISDLDKERITLIARTLGQTEVFNEVVREQTSKMEIGQRYQQITEGFNSIRDDSKRLVDQVEDGKIDLLERGTNIWMKIVRGDIADRSSRQPRRHSTTHRARWVRSPAPIRPSGRSSSWRATRSCAARRRRRSATRSPRTCRTT